MDSYLVGQRYISENETELGLGVVEAVDHRLVTVYFPLVEDSRTYSKDNAPLARYQLQPGDELTSKLGESFPVVGVETLNGLLVYMVDAGEPRPLPVPETELSPQVALNSAAQRLLAGQIDSKNWFELRHQVMQGRQLQHSSSVHGLQGPRVEPLPHQLYVAHEVANRALPRVLLADEVGLGKTIEAGLIIHQLLLSERAQRVLIIVPPALMNQWFVEMFRRFNLHFHQFDAERINSLLELDETLENAEAVHLDNPFLSEQLVLIDSDFLCRVDESLLLEGEWDLVVVDEAHHLEWSPEHAGLSYQRVEALANKVAGLLLLSATPEQLGLDSHFARLRLLDPDRFFDFEAFVKEQEAYAPVADLIEQLLDNPKWDDELKDKVAALIDDQPIDEVHRDAIVRELLDRNGTGRVVYRNTRQWIKGFPERQLIAHPLSHCEAYQFELPDHMEQAVAQALHPETAIGDDSWCQFDPRVKWLHQFLKERRKEKVLVICAHKDTAIALDIHCRFRLGLSSNTFHEDMDLIARDRAAAHFADFEDGAQVLFCSEIGSEGRNFQFAHTLVLMDLPLNPDLLEQRIGRLDRIGQKQAIEIHVPFMQGSAQEVIFHWYHQGMNAFCQVNRAGSQVFAECRAELVDALLQPENPSLQNALLEKTRALHQQYEQQLSQGRDRLLALASFDEKVGEQLAELVAEQDALSPQPLMEAIWERYGVNVDEQSDRSLILTPSARMVGGYFPALPEDGCHVTFDREQALSNDDRFFLNWEHPMVAGAIDMVLDEHRGSASVCVLQNKAVKAGTLLLELLFTLQANAPKYLQAQRYLPYTLHRLLLDAKGNDLAAKVSPEALNKQLKKLDKPLARQLIKSERENIAELIKKAEALAEKSLAPKRDKALQNMKNEQQEALNRLAALAKKNPNIRKEEFDFIERQTELLEKYLQSSAIELAAVRVIVAV